jgi:putative inorganic carbon (hco3(-)) transporter
LTAFMIVVLLALNIDKFGGARVGHFNAPFFMGDGNDLAWWMTIALPIVIALVFLSKSRLVQLIGLGGGGVAMLGIMGTGSRGAAMGVAAALLYAWLFVAKKKAVGAIAVVMALVGAAVMAPAGYFERLKTVTEYEQDNSAQARLQAWTGGIYMAIDHPLGVGAGNFSSAYGRFYLPSSEDSRLNWGQNRWFNAHSIYFKVLGEYGFPGLLMLFGIIGTLLYQNHRTRVKILSVTSGSPPLDDRIPALLNMSTIGFAVAGTFLSGFNYPHVFFLAGISFAVQRIVDLEYAEGPVAARAGAAAGTAPAAAVDKPRPVLPGGVRVPALGRAHQPARRTR